MDASDNKVRKCHKHINEDYEKVTTYNQSSQYEYMRGGTPAPVQCESFCKKAQESNLEDNKAD